MVSSKKLYYPEPLSAVPVFPAFHYRHPVKKGGALFREVDQSFFRDSETKNLAEADAIVLVHNFIQKPDKRVREYIRTHADIAEERGIPIYLFSCGDWTDSIHFDSRIFVFRFSLYASTRGPRDIATPVTTEDPPSELLYIRPKKAEPIVAFCGQGDFKTRRRWIKYFVQNTLIDVVSLGNPVMKARKIGVFWRRAMMKSCEQASGIVTNFIIRKTFSGHVHSVEIDPAQARKEYLETSAHADFVIAPKGDGNYSIRFFKTLAFGRIPVYVDTDAVFPLQDSIPYEKITVRVPMHDVKNTAQYIKDFYTSHSEEEWVQCQRLAREVFLQYLVQDSFFEEVFKNIPSRPTV